MNKGKLAKVLRERVEIILAREPRREDDFTNAELIAVLARLLEGKDVHKAFGAPGDWGYGTEIGKAIASPEEAAA